jgi:hypothetical protein
MIYFQCLSFSATWPHQTQFKFEVETERRGEERRGEKILIIKK